MVEGIGVKSPGHGGAAINDAPVALKSRTIRKLQSTFELRVNLLNVDKRA
jgi:hypothetical protein